MWLNDEGRKKVLSRWQEKKRSEMMHPYLKQKIPMGLLPYVQSNLLAEICTRRSGNLSIISFKVGRGITYDGLN